MVATPAPARFPRARPRSYPHPEDGRPPAPSAVREGPVPGEPGLRGVAIRAGDADRGRPRARRALQRASGGRCFLNRTRVAPLAAEREMGDGWRTTGCFDALTKQNSLIPS
jgi:hypothetical protein